jgi:molybdate transport system substrate-binding protein
MRHRFSTSFGAAILLVSLAVFLVAGVAACGSESTLTTDAGIATTAVEPRELMVSAAASLTAVFTEIGAAFDEENDAQTVFNFAPAGTLQKQIEAGAPVDVFASAAMKQMDALLEGGLVDEASVKVFAGNEMVIIVPADSNLGISSFEDLAKADVKKVTTGDPAVSPYGVAAEEILTRLGLFDQVKPKEIYPANIQAAVEYVAKGEVDAGIIFATEARAGGDRVRIAVTSDPSWHGAIVYPIAVVGASKNKALAQAFVDFVAGPEGQAILLNYGFLAAPAS